MELNQESNLDMLTTLPNMSITSELSNATVHGGIGSGYYVRNGIGYGIDTRNKQRQSKMTSNNDMTSTHKAIAIKRKTPDDGLKDEVAKKAKHPIFDKQKYVIQKSISAYILWKFPYIICSFAVDVNEQQLTQLAHNFNDEKDGQMEQKENQDGKHCKTAKMRHLS
ncbi:hypothetical protein RFI_24398 [Reticulomyxa filosa]|uniref:Uncharacterized protein n=1 Tax=Reticulomyxa filosa TaxID=46433 RepID=X6MHT0_RETFI|nr:hypothetical protein RFI_24398 [Reticulomyxa filosa]|eukprot:ETO12977.1 hypothetical protein RFI_24398 [Reticulomyxa filosa]